MTKETTPQGASGSNTGHPAKRPAFQPAHEYAGQGVDNEGKSGDHTDVQNKSLRDTVMEDIEARIDAERLKAIGLEMQEFDDSMQQAQEAAQVIEEEEEEETPEPETPETTNTEVDEEEYDDPLADFIVMDEDTNTPMFVLKVDGKQMYVPVDKARQQLQKHEAAEVRLQQAAQHAKQLEAREQQILAAEQALKQRQATTQASPPSTPPASDVSDQDLRKEAQEFVESMFAGTDSDAVEQLSKLLGKMRAAPQTPGQQIDPQELVRQAAIAAREEIRIENEKRDVNTGYARFSKDYPEIVADAELFRHADSMTDAIEAEWKNEGRSYMPSEVMLEAGKRTREWVEHLTGKKANPPPRNQQDRQVRKRKLRPMPKSSSQKQSLREAEAPEETPHDYVTELKKARGQA